MEILYKGDLENVGLIVCEAAESIFYNCGHKVDFCIQSAVGNVIVFGGNNRILFNPLSGFRLDHKYCSDRFIAAFNKNIKPKIQKLGE